MRLPAGAALAVLLALAGSGCGSTSAVSGNGGVRPAAPLPEGVTEYLFVDDVRSVPFIVIQADSHADDSFDLYLRDELVKVGFPKGVTRAQLGRLYLDAGLGDVAQAVDDPIAMYQLARALGPFLLLRVSYELDGWGLTTYDVKVWDAISSRTVFSQRRTKVVWWDFKREIGPPIVSSLSRWRDDCLSAESKPPAPQADTAI